MPDYREPGSPEEYWGQLENSSKEFQEEVIIALTYIIGHELFGKDKYERLSQIENDEMVFGERITSNEDEKLLYEQYLDFENKIDFENMTTKEFTDLILRDYGIRVTPEQITKARNTANEVMATKKRDE